MFEFNGWCFSCLLKGYCLEIESVFYLFFELFFFFIVNELDICEDLILCCKSELFVESVMLNEVFSYRCVCMYCGSF